MWVSFTYFQMDTPTEEEAVRPVSSVGLFFRIMSPAWWGRTCQGQRQSGTPRSKLHAWQRWICWPQGCWPGSGQGLRGTSPATQNCLPSLAWSCRPVWAWDPRRACHSTQWCSGCCRIHNMTSPQHLLAIITSLFNCCFIFCVHCIFFHHSFFCFSQEVFYSLCEPI